MSSKMCRGGHVMFRCSFCHQVTSKAKFAPLTNVQIFRNASDTRTRYNDIKVQMLSESLHNQIFSGNRCSSASHATKLQDVIEHLKSHDLWNKNTTILPEVNFKLPELKDSAIDDHFRQLAQRQIAPHVEGMRYLTAHDLPPMPKKWACQAGWTKYQRDGSVVQVDYPADDALVFDVEILVKEGNFPTMATAASPDAWYSWCSDRILKDKFKWNKTPTLQDLIPLETTRGSPEPGVQDWPPRTVVGHNVSFDRSFIKEQYYIKGSSMKFVDTMALHIAISGLTSFQRILYQARKSGSKRKEVLEEESKAARFGPPNLAWMDVSSLNNLSDVYQLHCRGPALKKPIREVFVEGSMQDVREQFQVLMTYCAGDVFATHAVVSKLWPQFFERFPHPVTLAGMLQMSTAYLPINANWQTYIQQSEETYQDLQRELKELLKRLANDACQFMHGKKYLHDPWLWDLDWSTRELKLKAGKAVGKKTQQPLKGKEEETAEDRVNRILKTEERLPKRPPHMPGYPAWYAELCPKPSEMNGNFEPGPAKISTQRRVVPKLLRLTWDGFPLHYSDKHGWGYLVPGRENAAVADVELDDQTPRYPTESLYEVCKPILSKAKLMDQKLVLQEDIRHLYDKLDLEELSLTGDEKNRLWEKIWDKEQEAGKLEKKSGLQQDKADRPSYHTGDGPYNDVEIPGCWFFKIPHKDGLGHRVGNPLAKDFISKVEDKVLQATSGGQADMVLNLSKMCSYWKNNKDRISSQMVLTLEKKELPEAVVRDKDYNEEEGGFGAILPRVVTAGTVTRRAVEPTWLTASNAYRDRVGSELKAMVQTPPGYHFVGADVDSQELWIAAILGDAHFAGTHGCTAFGWMTLQGKKSEGTDLHSKVASLVGISRDQAKIFNYGRIYGAGQKFAQRLLMQFNHRLTMKEAYDKARAMYLATKGKKARKNKKAVELNDGSDNSKVQAGMWHGGSESAMFNKLELIARSQRPRTPVLGARISCCLEPKNVDEDFMTSRINWVVQSSAVDYLHLMLVSMRWLFEEFDIDGRFCISIHDEVRYMVKSSDRYRAALALQITNLLTRSMFAYKLDMDDLPQSVAFFSAVDIDKCMRKEVKMDCKTPSNPHGLQGGYAIPEGEALDIYQILEKTNRTPERDKQPACDEAGGGQDLYHELEPMEMS